MASRSKGKAEEAIEELKALTGKEAIFLELDLASLASVRTAAETFLKWVQWKPHAWKYKKLTYLHQERATIAYPV